MIEVLAPGVLTLVEDLGRPGFAAVGVGRSGAADVRALRQGNRLVGNAPGAAGLEVLLGGLELWFPRTAAVALTGATVPVRVEGEDGRTSEAPMRTALRVPAGSCVRLGLATRGLRTYVAVRGGIDVPAVLGSRSTDVLSGIGPAPLAAGDVLPVGSQLDGFPELGTAAETVGTDPVVLAVRPGPRADWFVPEVWDALVSREYRVLPASNRVALRLDGPALGRCVLGELPSEGLVPGALQVPPDGRPVLFLADHPVTGGYPVVAVVRSGSLGAAAQVRPGDTVRFTLENGSRRHAG